LAAAARRSKPKKLWKIGEVMRHTGLSRQTVHNYTILGLIREEERTESGHRLYGDDVFDRLATVERLKKQGKTLKEIARVLARRAPAPSGGDDAIGP
jgi:DNA-binding transcriptional MerR regulator